MANAGPRQLFASAHEIRPKRERFRNSLGGNDASGAVSGGLPGGPGRKFDELAAGYGDDQRLWPGVIVFRNVELYYAGHGLRCPFYRDGSFSGSADLDDARPKKYRHFRVVIKFLQLGSAGINNAARWTEPRG